MRPDSFLVKKLFRRFRRKDVLIKIINNKEPMTVPQPLTSRQKGKSRASKEDA
jgi:hypothetical protein